MQVLLQHKDAGRTLDNGFKPEVWRLAAEALHGVEHVGGPKTPDACKSRWQRVRFTWDSRLMQRLTILAAAEGLQGGEGYGVLPGLHLG